VHTLPGAYSEIMVLTDRGGGIGRLVVDPFRRLLYSTDPKDVAAL
jgi:conjugal transfer ATP-binding protein TraC